MLPLKSGFFILFTYFDVRTYTVSNWILSED